MGGDELCWSEAAGTEQLSKTLPWGFEQLVQAAAVRRGRAVEVVEMGCLRTFFERIGVR